MVLGSWAISQFQEDAEQVGTDPADVITVTPGTGSGSCPVVQAKNNSFNAWETWEEY